MEQFVIEHLKERLTQLRLSDITLKQKKAKRGGESGKIGVCVCREAAERS
jgi:hypothetical protein